MTACNTITLPGGCGAVPCGSAPAGTSGVVELVGGVSEIPDFKAFSPTPGQAIGRLQHVAFDVTDDTGRFIMLFVTATFVDGTTECVWDGEKFTPRYAATSSVVSVQCGFRFTIRRAGGWVLSPLRIEVVAIDEDGNVGRSRNAFA